MTGTYMVIIDGPYKHLTFKVFINEDLSVDYILLNSTDVSIEIVESNRDHYPPHAHVSKLTASDGITVQVGVATVVGFDWSLLENERYDELFFSIVNYVDNHSTIFLETKAQAEEFIRNYCPR